MWPLQAKKSVYEQLDSMLRDKDSVKDLYNSTVEEIVEQVGIYHQELVCQNAELARVNEELEKTKQRYERLFNDAPVGYVVYDGNGSIREVNHTFCSMVGGSASALVGEKFARFVVPDHQDILYLMNNRLLETGKAQSVELKLRGQGGVIDATVVCNGFSAETCSDPGACGEEELLVRCTVMDITRLNEMLFVSYHDPMTGLYNRRYYEEKMADLDIFENLPLCVGVIDVDALKIINDSLGHDYGDQALVIVADTLRHLARPHYVIMRTGGDEIVIVFLQTDEREAEAYLAEARKDIEARQVGGINLSVSCGLAAKRHLRTDLSVLVSLAEDAMYGTKLLHSANKKDSIISVVLQRLFDRCPPLQAHVETVARYAGGLGRAVALPDGDLQCLEWAAWVHDIGLVTLLHQKDSPQELLRFDTSEFMRHPQIGCRILRSRYGIEKIANVVLFHHESWDGGGYPYGVKGEDIPLISRIIAVADMYAWATEKSSPLAVAEDAVVDMLEKSAGRKLDPRLVRVFVDRVLKEDQSDYAAEQPLGGHILFGGGIL